LTLSRTTGAQWSHQVGSAHLGDVGKELVQLLVGLEDAVAGEIVN
jgi:hypothetical protein